jgi:hypothetical protein
MCGASVATSALQRNVLFDEAMRRTGLTDFGDVWFLKPLDTLLNSLRTEARLTAAGVEIERERVVAALVNRLNFTEAIRRNPEILHEKPQVAAVIVSLPRTGSTMLQRLLASTPAFTAMRWWEVFNYAPVPREERGNPRQRRQAGQKIIDDFLQGNPELITSHPYQLEAPEEETPVLGQFFMGTLMEGFAYLPSYVEWLKTQDHRRVYAELRKVLQFMQWDDPTRCAKRWILKSSAHLASLGALCAEFPEALIIMSHRDPLQTVPSVCSLMTMLHALESDQMDKIIVGRFTAKRWAWNLERFMEWRSKLPAARFYDIPYRGLMEDPVSAVGRVLTRLGEPLTASTAAEIDSWLDANRRDKRPQHRYTLAEFGLSEDELRTDFKAYRSMFLQQ